MKHAIAIGFVMMAAATCGGGSGGGIGGTGPITQAQADQICMDVCAKEVECGSETDVESCIPTCADDFVGWARADAVQTLASCFIAAPCGTGDDECLASIQPLPIHEEWEAGCRSELAACLDQTDIDAACEVSPDPGDNDIGFFRFIAAPIMEEIIDCLAAPDCTARLDCIQGVLEVNGINF